MSSSLRWCLALLLLTFFPGIKVLLLPFQLASLLLAQIPLVAHVRHFSMMPYRAAVLNKGIFPVYSHLTTWITVVTESRRRKCFCWSHWSETQQPIPAMSVLVSGSSLLYPKSLYVLGWLVAGDNWRQKSFRSEYSCQPQSRCWWSRNVLPVVCKLHQSDVQGKLL